MSVYKPRGSSNHHYDFWFRGQRHHGSTETKNRRAALRYEARLKSRLKQARPAVIAAAEGKTFREVRIDYYEKVGKFTANASALQSSLRLAEAIVGADTPIRLVTDHAILGYRAKFRELPSDRTDNRENSSINDFTRLIARLANYARDVMHEPDVPHLASKVWVLDEKWRMRELGPDEEERLKEHSEPELAVMWEFALETGIRRKPLCALHWNQISRRLKRMTIIEKGQTPLVVPLSRRALEILDAVAAQHPELVFTFVAKKGGKSHAKGERYAVDPSYFWRRLKAVLRKVKISDFTVHDLRHTAATRLLRSCRNIVVVQRFLGHTTLRQTERYVHMVQNDVAAAIAARDLERDVANLQKIAILQAIPDGMPGLVSLEHLSMAIELRVQLDSRLGAELREAA